MPNFNVGERVWVACEHFIELHDHSHAMYQTKVVATQNRSVRLQLPNGQVSDLIGSSCIHRDLGIVIYSIGDFLTESTLLDPLAKSVLQYCRLLLPDDQVVLRKVRSLSELGRWCAHELKSYTHVILIGHGSKTGITFGIDGEIDATTLAKTMLIPHVSPKLFTSLCCKTGYQSFAGEFSNQKICSAIAAPFHSVHGAIASQFCQSILADHLLNGYRFRIAFNHARKTVPGIDSFRFWEAGKMTA